MYGLPRAAIIIGFEGQPENRGGAGEPDHILGAPANAFPRTKNVILASMSHFLQNPSVNAEPSRTSHIHLRGSRSAE